MSDLAITAAVALEQENAHLTERITWALEAAMDLNCTCPFGEEPDPCPACLVVDFLTIPDPLQADVIEARQQ